MRILVFQHLCVEHPGRLRDLWRARGLSWDTVALDEGEPIPDLGAYDLLVAMGGPMDVWEEHAHPWLAPEKAAIRRFVVDLGRPFLGICLGHQLLAEALGGAVSPARRPEVGLVPVDLSPAGRADPLLRGLDTPLETFQWHSSEVSRLPEGAVVLAGNEACAVQAMRWGRHAWGLQFHVEITADTVPEWRDIPAYAAALDTALGRDAAARLETDARDRLPAFAATARRLEANLHAIVDRARLAEIR